ncbi:DUF1259 domain-containing protein [Bacillus benzoevorans]|uniref:DUF1259 domain-containing protein n=1 Tax=Bacillus benzoevorans TaxID=1456 RepID=A0A7X0HUU5_9BACI|nr:DUF1259 domain-containing protein [Bacillus benzoevorans]MBB6447248.1 hypothetical protein [Bacillus benzoevorans]
MNNFDSICKQFAQILKGKSEVNQDGCSVSLHRGFTVLIQGRQSRSAVPVGVSFESMDQSGHALNMAEIAILQEEIPSFMHSIVQQGLIVSALHNHWLFTEPEILYIHIQSVEHPLTFAKKMAHSFSFLHRYPVA